MKTLQNYRELLLKFKGRKEQLEKLLIDLKQSKRQLEDKLNLIIESQKFFQQVAEDTQKNIILHIENIVNKALKSAFKNEYEFKFEIVKKRGRTETNFYLIRQDGGIVDIINGAGGGVVDIISFALRIAVWTLTRKDNVIILDEPFRFLSNDLQEYAGLMLQELANQLDLQFIIVTHNNILTEIGDKIF